MDNIPEKQKDIRELSTEELACKVNDKTQESVLKNLKKSGGQMTISFTDEEKEELQEITGEPVVIKELDDIMKNNAISFVSNWKEKNSATPINEKEYFKRCLRNAVSFEKISKRLFADEEG